MSRLPVVTGALPPFIPEEDQEENLRRDAVEGIPESSPEVRARAEQNLFAALGAGQREGQPLDRAIAAASRRARGGPQVIENPYVTGGNKFAVEERDAVQQLLGTTQDAEQRKELQRVLSVTEDRIQGRTTTPSEMFPEYANAAENIAKWATRNNRSRSSVNSAMRQLQAQQAARTSLSSSLQDKAKAAQAEQAALASFREANPEMASFAILDPETRQPTVDKAAMDAKIKFETMKQDAVRPAASRSVSKLTRFGNRLRRTRRPRRKPAATRVSPRQSHFRATRKSWRCTSIR
jgi:hypothetical protein